MLDGVLRAALACAALLFAGPAAAALGQEAGHDQGKGQEHDHQEGQSHGHDHGDFPEFVDVFFTHHAYLERKFHPRVDATLADPANEFVESGELAWQFTSWLGGEIELPVVQIDPEEGDGASGVGDFEVAPMVAVYRSAERRAIVTLRSGFALPTGDEDEGLGAAGWAWEPGILLWKGYGSDRRGALQAELTYERLYADEGADEEELVYNLAWSHWLPSNWIPIAELNGVTGLSDAPEVAKEEHDLEEASLALARRGRGLVPAHGEGVEAEEDTIVSGTLGFRYAFANGQQWGAGVQLPLTDTEAYDWRFVVGGIIHID